VAKPVKKFEGGLQKILKGAKMFDYRRTTLFCSEKRLSKHKMTVFSEKLGGMAPLLPLATPMSKKTTYGNITMIVVHNFQ